MSILDVSERNHGWHTVSESSGLELPLPLLVISSSPPLSSAVWRLVDVDALLRTSSTRLWEGFSRFGAFSALSIAVCSVLGVSYCTISPRQIQPPSLLAKTHLGSVNCSPFRRPGSRARSIPYDFCFRVRRLGSNGGDLRDSGSLVGQASCA